MEDFKKKNAADMNDKEIVFSQSIKAGNTTDEEAESPETGKEELPKEEKASSLEGEIKIDIEF